MSSTTKKKFVEKELAEDFSLPTDDQIILKILRSRGNNLHQVTDSSGEEYLASMPPKFRKTIWVKRGDYVIAEPIPEGQKVKYEIVRILSKDHMKYYMDQKVWPSEFLQDSNECVKSLTDDSNSTEFPDEYCSDSDDDNGEFIVCNPNKKVFYIDNSESDSSSNSEDEKT